MNSDLPVGWTAGTLSDLVRLQRGHDLPEPSRRPGAVPVMGSAGLSGHHDEAKVQGPGLVIGRSGASFGKVHYCRDGYWPLNTALFATDFLENEPRFVYFALRTIDFSGFNSGSAQPSLNRNFIASIPVAIPPQEEQQRIVVLLGALDDKIDSNRRLAALLEEAAATLFRGRFAGFVAVENFENSEIGPVPVGWRVGVLGELAAIAGRTVQPAAQPETSFEHFSIAAFDDGCGPVIESGGQMLSGKTAMPEGDCVLLSKLNPLTKRVWWPRPTRRVVAVCSPEFLIFEPLRGIPNTYLYALLASDDRFYNELLGHATGTTGSRQRVRPSEIVACRVLVPDAASLNEWNALTRPVYDFAHSLLAEARELARVRDALLPRLVSGQIRVPDTADPYEVIEPTSEALSVATP